MMQIMRVLAGTPQSKARYDDDVVDRLNHRYTQTILILFAIVVTTNDYVGDAIHCWVDAHFSDSWEAYTNQYCWIKNTYYLPLDANIPKAHEHEKREMIPYYQWVPLILLGQALMFFMPCLLWRTLNDRSGVTINSVVEEGWTFYESETAPEKKERLQRMVKHFHRWNGAFLSAKANRGTGCTTSCSAIIARILCPVCGKAQGNYLSMLYCVVKLVYLLNAIGQIFLLDVLLGYDFHFYGIHILQAMAMGTPWINSPRFPRVTMCDFFVRMLGNKQRYTVQCVLPINLFNEKIFIFLWFWFVMLALINLVSLMMWTLRMLFSKDHQRYIRNHLVESKYYNTYDRDKRGVLQAFIKDYLRADGVFVLRMVGHNVDGTSVNELITALWKNYRGKDDTIELEDIKPTTYD